MDCSELDQSGADQRRRRRRRVWAADSGLNRSLALDGGPTTFVYVKLVSEMIESPPWYAATVAAAAQIRSVWCRTVSKRLRLQEIG